MCSLRFSTAVPLILVLVAGCTERNEPTASTEALAATFFDLASRPEVAGVVIRGEGWARVGFIDGENEIISLHATHYPPVHPLCNSPIEYVPLYWQDVVSPSGKLHELWKAPESYVAVYDYRGMTTYPDCDYYNNVTGKLLAEGQVQWMYVDNDMTGGAAYGGTGGNVWQLKASGKVTNVVTGQPHGYHMMRKWHLLPDGTYLTSGAGPLLNPDPR